MDIGKVFKDSFSTLKRQYLFLLVTAILLSAHQMFRLYVGNTDKVWKLANDLVDLFIISFAWLYLLFRMRDLMLTKENILKFLKHFWRVIICYLALSLMVAIGVLLLIVPGIYLACKYGYCLVLIWDEDCGIGEAFRESARITMGNKFELSVLLIFICITSLLQFPFVKLQMRTAAASLQFDLLPTILYAMIVLFVLPLNISLYLNAYETMKNSGDDLQ